MRANLPLNDLRSQSNKNARHRQSRPRADGGDLRGYGAVTQYFMKARGFTARLRQRDQVAVSSLALALLFATLVLVVAFTFDRYGFTIDEELGFQRASNIYEFLASGGRSTESVSRFDLHRIYGAMPDVIALVLQKCVPALSFNSRHLVSALFGVAGIYYVSRLTAVFIGPETGLVAAVFLACNPMWFGYMFFNLKDIPFATTLLASSFYGLIGLTGQSRSWPVWLKLGASIGLLSTTKLIGPLLLGFVLLVSLAFFSRPSGAERVEIDKALGMRLMMGVISGIIGCLVCFFFFWPQFFFFNVSELYDVVKKFVDFKDWQGNVLLNGTYYSAENIPWYYTIIYIIISMPLTPLLLTPIGVFCGFQRRQPMVMAAAVICLGVLAEQALTGARTFNGYRHFLFLLPFLALVAAYPLGLLIRIRHRFLRFAAITTVLLSSAAATVEMYRLFPYQYSYYNTIVGGLRGADGKFYVDVWRSAFREAFDVIEKLADGRPEIRIFSCGRVITWGHPRIRLVTKLTDADYVVSVRRNCAMNGVQGLPVVAEIRRLGVLFAQVYDPYGALRMAPQFPP